MASEELKQTKERERKERKRRPSPSSTLSLSLVRFKSRRESIRVGFDRSSHRGGEKSRGAGPLVVASRVEEVEERRRRRKQQREREREREPFFSLSFFFVVVIVRQGFFSLALSILFLSFFSSIRASLSFSFFNPGESRERE
jgi:hypothetical protein